MQSETFRQPGLSVRNRIYRYIYEARDFCSRQAVASACGISMPTLYQNLSELMEEGLVQSSGEEQSTGGRRRRGWTSCRRRASPWASPWRSISSG